MYGAGKDASKVAAKNQIDGGWHHIVGTVNKDKTMTLYVDGEAVATGKAKELVTGMPAQHLQIGADEGGSVGDYPANFALSGAIDEVRIWHVALEGDKVTAQFQDPSAYAGEDPVLSLAMEGPKVPDTGTFKISPRSVNATRTPGKVKNALAFTGKVAAGGKGGGPKKPDTYVQHKWAKDVPVYARAMLLADRKLIIAGPRDVINEHETFERISGRDKTVENELAKQDDILQGKEGALLLIIDADGGDVLQQIELPTLPIWDSLATAKGKIYLTTQDGKVRCLGE